MKLKATMLDEYNSATNGSSAKSNLTNFIHVIQVFSEYIIDQIQQIISVKIPTIGRFSKRGTGCQGSCQR